MTIFKKHYLSSILFSVLTWLTFGLFFFIRRIRGNDTFTYIAGTATLILVLTFSVLSIIFCYLSNKNNKNTFTIEITKLLLNVIIVIYPFIMTLAIIAGIFLPEIKP